MDSKPILCIVGAILINLTLGTFYSIGNLNPYLASYMRAWVNPNVTSEHGTWLTSGFLLGQGLSMILGAYIEKKYSSRVANIIGCILHCSSTFLTIWAINVSFPLVVIIYGFGSGLGCGCSYIASMIAAQKWFPQKKGLYTGIIVAGFGFGGLIFTPLQTLYLNPDNINANSNGYFGEEVYSKVPSLFLYMGIVFTVLQLIGCLMAFPPSNSVSLYAESNTNPLDKNQNNPGTIITEESLPDMKSYTDAFKCKIFYLIGAMMMLVAPGVTFVNSLGKRYGQTYIKDDTFLAEVVAVAALANTVGRLFWGFIMDKYSFSTCYTIKVILFVMLITIFPFGFILSSKTLYLITILGLFFGFSGTFVLFPIFIEQVFGVKYHGTLYGILYIALSMASITTSFLIQIFLSPALEEEVKSPDDGLLVRLWPCLLIAVLYFVSLLLYYLTLPVRRLDHAISRRIEMNNIKANKNSLYNRSDLYPLERGTLADRTAQNIANESMTARKSGSISGGAGRMDRENSLGSIVRFRDGPKEIKKILNLLPKS